MPARVSRHQSVAAVTTLDFPGHPRMAGFPRGLVTLACHNFLSHPKPQLRRDEALAGGQHQHLALQILVLVIGAALAPIVVAAVCPYEIGGIVVNLRPLTFEKLVYIQVSHCVNWIAEDKADR